MEIRKFQKILVANRGEIALRIFRACYDLNLRTVAIYSQEDMYSLYRTRADEAYLIGENKSPLAAYLDIPGIVDLAKRRGVDAIHPGYGFLSENAEFARACEQAGIAFIGPSPKILDQMGDKLTAKAIAKAIFPGTQGGPLLHIIAAKAVCLGEALRPSFKEYGQQVVKNAQALAKGLLDRGVKLVSGGTDNHLMLIDLTDSELTGKELEHRLDEVYITANKNTVPGEKRSPFTTSGVRLGTPAVTTRGLKEEDMDEIAACIALCMEEGFEEKIDAIRSRVDAICQKYPLYA